MSNIDPDRLDIWLSKAEGRVARLKRKTAAKRKLDKHLSRLIDYSKSKTASNAERVKIQEKLASIEKKLAGSGDVVPTLDEVEQMVDEIYGDQSKNETFYFQRRRRRQASQTRVAGLSLRDLKDGMRVRNKRNPEWGIWRVEKTPGGEWTVWSEDRGRGHSKALLNPEGWSKVARGASVSSQQANWYDKNAASPDMDGTPWYKVPLEDAQEHSDQMYGDQSANETYYFERREEGGEELPRWAQKDADRDVESYNVAPDQYRLKERKFDAQNVVHNWYEEQKEASSSIPGLQEDGMGVDEKDYTKNPGEWWKEDRQSSQSENGSWYSKKKTRRR